MSNKELSEYFYEHVMYEISMFNQIIKVLANKKLNDLEKNIIIESFVLHLRNLIDFLYPRNHYKKDDVTANNFIKGQIFSKKFPLSISLNTARKRADKEVNHLTTRRIAGVKPEKVWEVGDLHTEVTKLLSSFFQIASDKKLDKTLSKKLLN